MKYQTESEFEAEILEISRRLERETGRAVERDHNESPTGGISCDFDLPYSSLPSLQGGRWAATR